MCQAEESVWGSKAETCPQNSCKEEGCRVVVVRLTEKNGETAQQQQAGAERQTGFTHDLDSRPLVMAFWKAVPKVLTTVCQCWPWTLTGLRVVGG